MQIILHCTAQFYALCTLVGPTQNNKTQRHKYKYDILTKQSMQTNLVTNKQ